MAAPDSTSDTAYQSVVIPIGPMSTLELSAETLRRRGWTYEFTRHFLRTRSGACDQHVDQALQMLAIRYLLETMLSVERS